MEFKLLIELRNGARLSCTVDDETQPDAFNKLYDQITDARRTDKLLRLENGRDLLIVDARAIEAVYKDIFDSAKPMPGAALLGKPIEIFGKPNYGLMLVEYIPPSPEPPDPDS